MLIGCVRMIWIYFISSYFVGTIMFGFLVIKVIHHKDLRHLGSGNVGARNAGREHGKKEFILIFLGDALKGVIVVVFASLLHFPEYVQVLGLALCIIGHIKPVTLNFQGGKGISTFIGGIIAFEPLVVSVIIIAFLILYPILKSFTIAGLGAFLCIPILLVFREYDWISCLLVTAIIVMICFAHTENISERLRKI
jgi:acyl phosphate:glycerol-3-phosphate acyltransferase